MSTQAIAETETEKASLSVAMDMVQAWNELDVDKIADLFAEDAVLHSVMIEPIQGREVLRAHLAALLKGASYLELQLKNVAVSGNVVFLERVDTFKVGEQEGAVPVVGILVIKDGHVQEWREYYDRAQLLSEMGVAQIDSPALNKH
ncbi:SgcJ/EcaC family oxidoreductase [Kordiimonas pumila]|uniref:SgcJ/EcaC family oxidoreductase n=1 Tax=Kordiimonas pumila TaxID=2161677 RepID=A0ABV7D5V8_9PROT|nr:nuclear transport factor 2 family protein [Kordiimonas pumila]